MSLINPSREFVYCSNLASDYSLIRFIRFVSPFTDSSHNAFLFRLDLSLHTGAGKKFGILNFITKHGLDATARPAPGRINGRGPPRRVVFYCLGVSNHAMQAPLG